VLSHPPAPDPHTGASASPDATSAERFAGVRLVLLTAQGRFATFSARFCTNNPASNTFGSRCGLAATVPRKVAEERFGLFPTCLK
jgi:hypothetical protein